MGDSPNSSHCVNSCGFFHKLSLHEEPEQEEEEAKEQEEQEEQEEAEEEDE